MISFTNVSKIYQQEQQATLRDISFSIKKGEFVSIVGPSGEGKSTILKIIAGIEKPTRGEVVVPERVSMAFQTSALLPWLSVFDNVAFGLHAQGMSEREIESVAITYIRMMGLMSVISKYPGDLSGGQRQRVGIARALAVDPDVLLLDEPFSALDPKKTAELHDDIIRIWRETGKTIVMVSHIIEEAVSLAQRVFLIKKGELHSTFKIDLPYPRRDQGHRFMYDVERIRKDFFA